VEGRDSISFHELNEIFPAPAADPTQISFYLSTAAHITAKGLKADIKQSLHDFTGFKPTSHPPGLRGKIPHVGSDYVKVSTDQPLWLPEAESGNAKGRWQRQVRSDTTIELACSPTFHAKDMNIEVRRSLTSHTYITTHP
jgi:hypothetical protein